MKISVERLKQIIKEEVDAYALQEKLDDKDKKKKAKLEDELDDLEHKWVEEGKLSSALIERYQLKESVGKVLWHSLDKDGQIGVYDMKFGDTIIRNLTEADLAEKHLKEHPKEGKHGVQEVNDPKRRKR